MPVVVRPIVGGIEADNARRAGIVDMINSNNSTPVA
jgi:hypothetical protein